MPLSISVLQPWLLRIYPIFLHLVSLCFYQEWLFACAILYLVPSLSRLLQLLYLLDLTLTDRTSVKLASSCLAIWMALLLSSTRTFPGNTHNDMAEIGFVPSAGSILNPTDTCWARCWPRVLTRWVVAQVESHSGWSPGWAFPSPVRRVIGRISFVGIESGRLRIRSAWLEMKHLHPGA